MEIYTNNSSKGEEEDELGNKLIVLILVGAPGSGKSTFCESVMNSSMRQWVRICQDTIGNGKAGTRAQCISSASSALRDGKSVFIDRCNLDREQRADFVNLGGPRVEVHAVVLDLPAKLCIARAVKRSGHDGNLQGGKAAAVVNRMLQKKELPKLNEGFSRITFCQNEGDVGTAVGTYSALGSFSTLPKGCFGQKNSDTKVQVGIMKFLKKVDVPTNTDSNEMGSLNSTAIRPQVENNDKDPQVVSLLARSDDKIIKSGDRVKVRNDIPTLAFPSISTADFQFNLEKASDIIVERVDEFVNKIGDARLVLVDLSHGSKILSLVKNKAAQRNIDSHKFFTYVGDITRLHSNGGLRCNVLANAANWRLKPGGGGVNAAIYSAAGSFLETATKERASSLLPGKTLVVPLPPLSPLYTKEGVTHVIHVLGPNMNPSRPNCLNNDYDKGSEVLHEAYTSLFEGFASIVNNQSTSLESSTTDPSPVNRIQFPDGEKKNKRETLSESLRNKKCKGVEDDIKADVTDSRIGKKDPTNSKTWGSWAQGLYRIATNPEGYKNVVLEISENLVVLNDLYPKAQKHLLVLARSEGLESLANVDKEHLPLIRTMHSVGLKWVESFLSKDDSLVFRLGYHSVPSMRQLHLHVISQDFNSESLKNKKHWNSFNTQFFRDSVDVIEEVSNHGKALLKDEDKFLSIEIRCHRCRSAHPSIPRLKSHISNCAAQFPSNLLQNGRLVFAHSESTIKD